MDVACRYGCDIYQPRRELMIKFLFQRLIAALVVLLAFSFVVFFLIQLPPGDYADAYAAARAADGDVVTPEELADIRDRFRLDRPFHIQYIHWFGRVLQGDLGFSFEYKKPVSQVLAERLPLTLGIAFAALAVIIGALIGTTWVALLTGLFIFLGTEGIDMVKETLKSFL